MEEVTALFLYKIASLGSGTFIIWLGYRLFTFGITDPAGDLDAKYKKYKLILKGAAPGTFFVIFGAIVIMIALLKGIDLIDYSADDPEDYELPAPPL